MRIPHWPVLVLGGLLAAVIGQTTLADDSADGYIDASPVVNAAGGSGELFADPGYQNDAGFSPAYQPVPYMQGGPGMPEGPGIPGGYGGPSHYGAGGSPNAWPGVSPYTQHNSESFYNDAGIWSYDANDERSKGTLGLEFLIVWGLKPGNQLIGSELSTIFDDPAFVKSFPNQRFSNFDDLKHYGVRARYGWESPDESSILLSGFYVAENSATLGPNTPHFNPIYGPITPPFGIQQLASITYNLPGFGPLFVLFDTSFEKTYDQQAWGADIDVYAAPFFRRGSFKMQMEYGVKYVRIFESMSVRAVSSNLGYTVVNDGTITDVTDFGFPPLVTVIGSEVTSNLVGPQIGVRYDLGGEKFKIWGQSKVAVAANMDRTSVFGSNAVNNFAITAPGDNPFNSSIRHTHVSPIFEQSIYGEFPLFSFLPIVNRWSFINQANFRIGFNYLLIGEMARPANSITYTFANPTPNADRTLFSLKTLSFAVDWKW